MLMRHYVILLLGCVVTLGGCATDRSSGTGAATGGIVQEADLPCIALVTAYEPETEALLELLEESGEAEIDSVEQIKGVVFHKGHYRGEPIIVFATGISVVNAAMSTQIAFDHFRVEALLFSGIAGGINDRWKAADVVVPERWYYHDESAYFNEGEDGEYVVADYFRNTNYYPQNRSDDPHSPDYRNYGMIFPAEVAIIKQGWEARRTTPYFTVDPTLLALANDAVSDMEPIPVSDTRAAQVHVGGNGVTGSVFLDNADYRRWVREVWDAEVTEMESAAVGQVATVNEVPWIIIRSVSDLAGGQKGKNEENIYEHAASTNAAKVMLAIMDEWVEQTRD